MVGQTVSLILGTCSGLSFSFLICAIAISSFRPQLLRRGLSYGSISTLYWCLTYIALLLMFAPAAVNLAFVFVWRSASDLQLDPKHRCFVDIDLVWAKTTHRLCKLDTIPWGVWVTLSSLRLAVTSATLVSAKYVIFANLVINHAPAGLPVCPVQAQSDQRCSGAAFPRETSNKSLGPVFVSFGVADRISLGCTISTWAFLAYIDDAEPTSEYLPVFAFLPDEDFNDTSSAHAVILVWFIWSWRGCFAGGIKVFGCGPRAA